MFSSLRKKLSPNNVVCNVRVLDVRFPTSREAHGSDAIHKDPDYSAAYVILSARDLELQGHGLTFTLGRGTDVVISAIHALLPQLMNKPLLEIFTNFGSFWHALTNESQLRWIGPEKGVIHLATAAVINALWDLWAKIEGKPLWKLLSDMSPQEIVSLVDFTHLTDVLTRDDAVKMLSDKMPGRVKREEELRRHGYPCYITSIGWLGYSDDKIRDLCKRALGVGFTRFKMKVGCDAKDDARRAGIIRSEIGYDYPLMMDANQVWDVSTAIDHMTKLVEFKPLWIEEPTSPDDILGHAKIGKALKKFDIGIATGEMAHNRVMFKQFLEAGAMDYCQIDSCRLGGINEIISVLLLAAKFGVPVCPHAGGVGLCEYVQHIAMFDFVAVSGSMENRMIEFADHLHEHFLNPVEVRKGSYYPTDAPGYSEMREASLAKFLYPTGPVWSSKTQ